MVDSNFNRSRVAVYLANDDYSPDTGGALATWTFQVYSRLADSFDARVFSRNVKKGYSSPKCETLIAPTMANAVYGLIRRRNAKGLLTTLKRMLRQRPMVLAAEQICRFRPDIIHVHNDPEAARVIRVKNRAAKIVLHMNNSHLADGAVSEDNLAAACTEAADAVVFCSSFLMKEARDSVPLLQPEKCFVVPNGCKTVEYEPRSALTQAQKQADPRLLFVGRLVREKGVDILLDAFALVLDAFPDASLKVVGGITFGSNELNCFAMGLLERAKTMGDRVQFLGAVSHNEIDQYFECADIFVCPSVWNEPFGMVNIEALSHGLPVVAFAKGGIPEAIGDAGILLEEFNASSLAEAICRLVRDGDLYATLSERAKRRAKKFDWQAIASQWRELLTTI